MIKIILDIQIKEPVSRHKFSHKLNDAIYLANKNKNIIIQPILYSGDKTNTFGCTSIIYSNENLLVNTDKIKQEKQEYKDIISKIKRYNNCMFTVKTILKFIK